MSEISEGRWVPGKKAVQERPANRTPGRPVERGLERCTNWSTVSRRKDEAEVLQQATPQGPFRRLDDVVADLFHHEFKLRMPSCRGCPEAFQLGQCALVVWRTREGPLNAGSAAGRRSNTTHPQGLVRTFPSQCETTGPSRLPFCETDRS
eukprot:362776-Chlamydomonas_euryale.AAC.7